MRMNGEHLLLKSVKNVIKIIILLKNICIIVNYIHIIIHILWGKRKEFIALAIKVIFYWKNNQYAILCLADKPHYKTTVKCVTICLICSFLQKLSAGSRTHNSCSI